MQSEVQLSEQMHNEIKSICGEFPQIERIVLFGSRAKGCATERSDIDLALFGSNVSRLVVGELRSRFEESALPVSVDVVAFDLVVHEKLKEHILRVGVEIFRNTHP